MRLLVWLGAAALCAGCAGPETIRFAAKAQQEALKRDGLAALASRGKNSLVLVRPAAREFQAGARPVFVVGIYNMTRAPLEFRVADVQATQVIEQQSFGLAVVTYEELVREERNRQIANAILVGVAVAGNSYYASQAGYYNSNSTVTTPRGNTYQVATTGYSPTAAAIAQSNAAIQNEAMISSTLEYGQRNLAALERGVIKDNTLLPGEWYGGQLHLQAPATPKSGAAKTYSLTLNVGSDRHQIDIVQENAR